ncbi:MAG: fumarylacetoacetate hydrolase family protein [Acidimicrobiia bacterium]|nr:fumarylacetoacetate hydrolase family protein [Acidimicrobiia bacterium]
MKIVRARTDDDEISYGGVEPEGIRLYRGSPFVAWEPTEVVIDFDSARLLSPTIPTKVVAVGRNFVAHAAELNNPVPEEPLIFIKPSTSVIGPAAAIRLPPHSKQVEHEAELAMVIGKVARHVAVEDAASYVLGYTVGQDITARDLQRRDGHFTRGKGFDTFCPLGPAIETEFDPLEGQRLTCRVNGVTRQDGVLSDMVFGVAELVAFITGVMTLLPGDVILTGTPEGVGPLVDGDLLETEIEGLGVLKNPVAT